MLRNRLHPSHSRQCHRPLEHSPCFPFTVSLSPSPSPSCTLRTFTDYKSPLLPIATSPPSPADSVASLPTPTSTIAKPSNKLKRNHPFTPASSLSRPNSSWCLPNSSSYPSDPSMTPMMTCRGTRRCHGHWVLPWIPSPRRGPRPRLERTRKDKNTIGIFGAVRSAPLEIMSEVQAPEVEERAHGKWVGAVRIRWCYRKDLLSLKNWPERNLPKVWMIVQNPYRSSSSHPQMNILKLRRAPQLLLSLRPKQKELLLVIGLPKQRFVVEPMQITRGIQRNGEIGWELDNHPHNKLVMSLPKQRFVVDPCVRLTL